MKKKNKPKPFDISVKTKARFWKCVRKTGSCWIWTGVRNARGYGIIHAGTSRNVLAHRASWFLHLGVIPAGKHVLHRCDNPPCVNPDHLFIGTAQDNVTDAWNKGRMAGRRMEGVLNPKARLSELDVTEIRKLYAAGGVLQRQLAERFGVSQVWISSIVKGHGWRHCYA